MRKDYVLATGDYVMESAKDSIVSQETVGIQRGSDGKHLLPEPFFCPKETKCFLLSTGRTRRSLSK